MLSKRRIFTLVSITVIFAVFFGFYQSYISQAVVYSLSKNTTSFQASHYTHTESTSNYKNTAFTGAFEIRSVAHISGDTFDANKTHNFQYHLEYPEFIYISDTPIQNFLKAQFRQFQRDLQKIKTGEITASFRGFSGQNYKTLIYSLGYHIDDTRDYQRLHMFLINSSGAYVSPKSIFSLSSQNDFSAQIFPHIQQQYEDIFSDADFSDGIAHWISQPTFAFDNSDVLLFFEAGTIAGREQGALVVRVPYTDLQPFFLQNPKKIQELKKIEVLENTETPMQSRISKDGKKYIALTFDDGPNTTSTVKLLDILKQKWVQATFFVLGQNAQKNPDILKRIHHEWHEIENHTWDHKTLTHLSTKDIQNQIIRTDAIIKEIIGQEPKFVRPPYGAFNQKVIESIGKPMLMWSVDPKDWKYRNIQHNIASTLKQTKNGSIIIFHDIHDVSVRTMPRLIDELRMRGYEFITVEKLFLRYQSELPKGEVVCYSWDRCK